MCENCEERFKEIPAEMVQKMDELQFEYVTLMDKIGALLADNIDMQVINAETGEPAEVEDTDKATVDQQMVELKRIMGSSYALGWYSCADQPSVLQAAMVMQPVTSLINKGSHDSLAYNYVKRGHKH